MMFRNNRSFAVAIFACMLMLLMAPAVDSQSGQQGRQEADARLFIASSKTCTQIVDQSKFEGDCCALNVTDAGGCILNVVNGRCKVTGGVWTLEYISTFDSGGATCPPGEVPSGAITDFPTSAPGDDGSAASTNHGIVAMLGAAMAGAALSL
uniref:Uncharacterized protein n=1 Tax=Craspedostauros australis TaxID=1486917 RepID=A0A7R9WV40_9STRA